MSGLSTMELLWVNEKQKNDELHAELDRLKAALTRIVEWCDGTRGPEDHERDPYQTIGDCAKRALSPRKDEGV